MIKPEQIPDEAIYAAVFAEDHGKDMAQIIAAAINAWPGAERVRLGSFEPIEELILPMPQEKNDE